MMVTITCFCINYISCVSVCIGCNENDSSKPNFGISTCRVYFTCFYLCWQLCTVSPNTI